MDAVVKNFPKPAPAAEKTSLVVALKNLLYYVRGRNLGRVSLHHADDRVAAQRGPLELDQLPGGEPQSHPRRLLLDQGRGIEARCRMP